MLPVLVLPLIAAQTSSPVPDPQNAQMITVNHQLSTRSSLSLSLIYLLLLTLISSNYNFLISRYPHMDLDQGCRSPSILPSRMGECGVRGALLLQIRSLFEHCSKRGGGSKPCSKILEQILYDFKGILAT